MTASSLVRVAMRDAYTTLSVIGTSVFEPRCIAPTLNPLHVAALADPASPDPTNADPVALTMRVRRSTDCDALAASSDTARFDTG